jgi:hypothetical protein
MLGASLEAALKNGYVKNQKEYFDLRKLYRTLHVSWFLQMHL